MADVISRIPELIEQGNKFSYENFSSKSSHGFPANYSDDWLVWTHHVGVVVSGLGESPIRASIQRGLGMGLLGEDEDDFRRAHGSILSGLRAAHRVFGETIPASDRAVTLGHNSPEQVEALQKIDELVSAVEAKNDFPGDPEFKEQVIAELSAGRRLLEAARVRVTAVREALGPPIKWIIEKGGSAMISKMAGDLWQYLSKLLF